MKKALLLILALFVTSLAAVAPASAATSRERGFSVTDFDRIRVIGPFVVELETGKAPSARATGSPQSLERVSIVMQGQMLVIRADSSAWGGWPGRKYETAKVKITVPMLRSASVEGSGTLSINRLKGQKLTLGVTGAGNLIVDQIQADQLNLSLLGDGSATLTGTANIGVATGRGTSSLKAGLLKVKSLEMAWQSAGNAEIEAISVAKIVSIGAGNVTVLGTKTACTVDASGAGQVICAGAAGSTLN
jgi:hypothetical protein